MTHFLFLGSSEMAVSAPTFLAQAGTGDADARESTTDCGHLDGTAPTDPTVYLEICLCTTMLCHMVFHVIKAHLIKVFPCLGNHKSRTLSIFRGIKCLATALGIVPAVAIFVPDPCSAIVERLLLCELLSDFALAVSTFPYAVGDLPSSQCPSVRTH